MLHPGGTVRAADLPARYRAAAAAAGDLFDPAPEPAIPESPVRAAAPVADPTGLSALTTLPPQGIDLRGHMAGIELGLLRAALEQAGGVVAHAAPLLGLRRTTLVEKLRKYGLDREQVAGNEPAGERRAAAF